MKKNFGTILLLTGTLLFEQGRAASVWVEGEDVASTNIAAHPWYAGEVKKDQLSGGAFLAHFDPDKAGKAEYTFTVPEDGDYTFWLRANPAQSSLKYTLDAGEAVAVDFSSNQTDNTNIAGNGAPDLRFLAWCEVGRFPLKAGKHTLQFLMDSANSHHGSIDCFLFTTEPFTPAGTRKPGDRMAAGNEDGWVDWNPAADPFAASAMDLRSLNETFAGENGWIQAKGEKFVHEKSGQPVRFWGVNGPPHDLKGSSLQDCARLLAKHGVNLVRLHSSFYDNKTGQILPEALVHKQEIVEAMKKEGIYSLLSIYFPLWMNPVGGESWQEGYDGQKHPFALLYFEPEFQKIYQNWWKEILTSKTPAGHRLVDDPALMGLELVNEDSFFFWTFNYENVPDPQMRKLEKLFGEWTIKKYGTVAKALAVWKNQTHARDDAREGRLGFRSLSDMFSQKSPRDQDTAAFLMETQAKFYADTVKFLRGLGYKGLITASNWTTANNDVFGPLEKYSYMSGDFIDRHGYFGSNHQGENSGWSLREGHTYSDVSGLRFDAEEPGKPKRFSHPAMDPMYNSKPSMISETTWNRPNRYRGEAPLFYAAYGALQDSDSIVHFALDGHRWNVKPQFFMQPWTLMSPTQMGQFPAAALIYRKGLISPGEVVADLPLKLEDALALKGSRLVQKANLDKLRKADVMDDVGDASDAGIDPLIHMVGRSNVRIDVKGGTARVADLTAYIDRKASSVTSSTGEVKLDYGKGLLRLDAPGAQGVSGHLKLGGPADLQDVSIQSELEIGHIVAVALDGLPLATSSKILVQAMTEEKTTGFATNPESGGLKRIVSLGKDPWLFREIHGTIKFKRPDAGQLKVTALDFNGYPSREAGSAADLKLLPDKVYYLIQKITAPPY